ncbi:hypothetical protein ACF1AJ_20630 [Leifsonia sp. NPDC014704]|uniref:hypothetical protein n=1 Tax=Leifsonia sp. NPDC014704 TaxID=3364123 RepID=UPI0036F4A96C
MKRVTPVMVFLLAMFVGGAVLVVLALLYGSGEAGMTLYRIGAVVMLASALTAMSDRLVRYLGGGPR